MQGKNTLMRSLRFDDDPAPGRCGGEPDDERIGDIGIGVDPVRGRGPGATRR